MFILENILVLSFHVVRRWMLSSSAGSIDNIDNNTISAIPIISAIPVFTYANLHTGRKLEPKQLEKVQKRATKLIKGLKKLSYKERLRKLRLPTLKYRRIREDMIEVYKVISCKYDSSVSMQIPTNVESFTRGNKYKL